MPKQIKNNSFWQFWLVVSLWNWWLTVCKVKKNTANVMVYSSPCTNKFYLSRNANIKLGIINSNLSSIGAPIEYCAVNEDLKTCDYLSRTSPPEKPDELPFTYIPKTIKSWESDFWIGTLRLNLINVLTDCFQK